MVNEVVFLHLANLVENVQPFFLKKEFNLFNNVFWIINKMAACGAISFLHLLLSSFNVSKANMKENLQLFLSFINYIALKQKTPYFYNSSICSYLNLIKYENFSIASISHILFSYISPGAILAPHPPLQYCSI